MQPIGVMKGSVEGNICVEVICGAGGIIHARTYYTIEMGAS